MKTLQMYGTNKYDLKCEITDFLNKTYNKCDQEYDGLYVMVYDKETLLIRGHGMSRGYILFDCNRIITKIVIYDEYNYDTCGVFDPKDKSAIETSLQSYIGYKIL